MTKRIRLALNRLIRMFASDVAKGATESIIQSYREAIQAELEWAQTRPAMDTSIRGWKIAQGILSGKTVDISPDSFGADELVAVQVGTGVEDWIVETSKYETETTAKQMAQLYDTGLAGQDRIGDFSAQKLAWHIEENGLALNKARATLMARTLSAWAMSHGTESLYESEGVAVKEWFVASDDLTCPFCRPMHEAKIAVGGNFWGAGDEIALDTGETMKVAFDVRHPPLHPHCRCVLLPVLDMSAIEAQWGEKDQDAIVKRANQVALVQVAASATRARKAAAGTVREAEATLKESEALRAAEEARREAEAAAKRASESRKISSIPHGIEGAEAFGRKIKPTNESVGGSTGAKVFIDDNGDRWIVKDHEGHEDQAKNEFLANKLYAASHVRVAESRLARIDGKIVFCSKEIDDVGHSIGESNWMVSSEVAKAQKGFAVDAWLANWDVVGMSGDNILFDKKGRAWRVDQGGALSFRALGTPKGALFGVDVTELASLRDGQINPTSANTFESLDEETIKRQCRTLAKKWNKKKITETVSDAGLTGVQAAEMVHVLEERRKFLLRYGTKKEQSFAEYAKQFATTPDEAIEQTRKFFNEYKKRHANRIDDLKSYTGGGYGDINESLRGYRKTGVPLPEKLKKRVENITEVLKSAPKYRGVVYRGANFFNDKVARDYIHGPNGIKDEPGFSSTSMLDEMAFFGDVKVKIHSRTGVCVKPVSLNPEEDEVLFPPGTRFKIDKVKKNEEGFYSVEVSEIE